MTKIRATNCHVTDEQRQNEGLQICSPSDVSKTPQSWPELNLLFDWGSHDAAPLGPGAIVIADVAVSQKLSQNEPRMRRPFADPAVGDGLFAAVDSLAAIKNLQVISRFEGSILRHSLSPRHVGCARDVPAALGAFLGQVLRGQKLAGILGGGPDVDQGDAARVNFAQHLIAVGADVLVGGFCRVGLRGVADGVGGQGLALGIPLGPPAVHQLDVGVPVVLHLPKGPGGELVVIVAIEDDRGGGVDTGGT